MKYDVLIILVIKVLLRFRTAFWEALGNNR
jgi:hypothetical protein